MTEQVFVTAYVVLFRERGGDAIYLYSGADELRADLVNVPPSKAEPALIFRVRNEDGGTELLTMVEQAPDASWVPTGNLGDGIHARGRSSIR